MSQHSMALPISDEVRQMVQPGRTIRVIYSKVSGKDNPNNALLHIRAIVDEDCVVWRRWSRSMGWVYVVDDLYWFEVRHKDPNILLVVGEVRNG